MSDDGAALLNVQTDRSKEANWPFRIWVGLSVVIFIVGVVMIGIAVRKTDKTCDPDPFVPMGMALVVVYPYQLGTLSMNITVESRPGPLAHISFLNVHENENTSVVAIRAMQLYRGGVVTRLNHGGGRYIRFQLAGDPIPANVYVFDPNRMFTPFGIQQTLKLNGNYSDAAAAAVAQFAAQVLSVYNFNAQATVYSLHNNGDYSALDYLPGHIFANDAAAVYLNSAISPHNFYFVTTQRLYDTIMASGNNVVLQSTTSVSDDGSLSYYCYLQNNRDYVNIEALAEYTASGDQVIKQLIMLETMTHAFYGNLEL